MLRHRIIPCLQLIDNSLVKAVQFGKYGYIGDPINTVRIFNELEVDELCLLDIRASREGRLPNLQLLSEVANECFMPLSYGGGVTSLQTAIEILTIGFEKVVLNTAAVQNPGLVTEIASHFGSQSVIASVDVKKNLFGQYKVYIQDGKLKTDLDPVNWCLKLQELGAGELLITSMDREGTWEGFDLQFVQKIADVVSIPVIAQGGAGKVQDIEALFTRTKASAAALGSMVVYQSKGLGVLVNFPDRQKLEKFL